MSRQSASVSFWRKGLCQPAALPSSSSKGGAIIAIAIAVDQYSPWDRSSHSGWIYSHMPTWMWPYIHLLSRESIPKFSPQNATKDLKTWLQQNLFQEQITVAVYNSCLTSRACVQSLDWWEELESYLHNRSCWFANLARLMLETAFSVVPSSYTKRQKASLQKKNVEYNSSPNIVWISGIWKTPK